MATSYSCEMQNKTWGGRCIHNQDHNGGLSLIFISEKLFSCSSNGIFYIYMPNCCPKEGKKIPLQKYRISCFDFVVGLNF